MTRAAFLLVGALLLSACSESIDPALTREACLDAELLLGSMQRLDPAVARALTNRVERCAVEGLL